jgi:hypothetical protein
MTVLWRLRRIMCWLWAMGGGWVWVVLIERRIRGIKV